MEQPSVQTMRVSIFFIMYTEKSTLAYSKNRDISAAHREKHKKKECRAVNWDLDSNLFSPHKNKYAADGSPFFPYTKKRRGYLCFMCICSCYGTKMLLC